MNKMIPKNITKNDILNAIKEIDKNGIPKHRVARKYKLIYEEKEYPPKYVVALANEYANGKEINPSDFGGGQETNDYLTRLGFEIVQNAPSSMRSIKENNITKRENKKEATHNERCPECKQTIAKLLEKIYGKIEQNYKFEIGVRPEDFIDTPIYHKLKEIFESLQNHRGFQEFIRAKTLPNVDYYIPNPGFIVEFDESQHFTQPRKLTLNNYPAKLKLGYDNEKWISLCEKINANDNDPPYRDEQRAWYDTLRDFLPSIKQLHPTIRLYSRGFRWCDLNPEVDSDINKFKTLLKSRKTQSMIEIKEDPNPSLARIIIAGEWDGDVYTSKKVLQQICDVWPKGKNVDCIITCGAFLEFDWPKSLPDYGDNKYPDKNTLNMLIVEATKQCQLLLDETLRHRLCNHTRYITIGIDSHKDKISFSSASIRHPHVELVVFIDIAANQYFWTGKSYPTPGQENGLLRFQDIRTHFIEVGFGKVLILGCHDLNVFNPRGRATTKAEWRKNVRTEFYNTIKNEKPKIVLHHPHTTDSSRIWTPAWNELIRVAPTVEKYIGAGRYYNQNGTRSNLDEILGKTKLGNTIDFVIDIEV